MTGRSTVIHEFDGYLYCDPWCVFHRSGVGQETVCFPSAMQSGEQSTAGLEICKDPHLCSHTYKHLLLWLGENNKQLQLINNTTPGVRCEGCYLIAQKKMLELKVQ